MPKNEEPHYYLGAKSDFSKSDVSALDQSYLNYMKSGVSTSSISIAPYDFTKGVPKDKNSYAYIIFVIFGIGTLLPWNALLTGFDFFISRVSLQPILPSKICTRFSAAQLRSSLCVSAFAERAELRVPFSHGDCWRSHWPSNADPREQLLYLRDLYRVPFCYGVSRRRCRIYR